ncbi:GTP 3',8-cyclase MoaA [Galbitalea soli]|uniref:GTP 3',8-cyclase n=1 Tax=Galbitalea soli TaxID=1268042 RepID=A0A7C9PMF3_9MICO|nr:GTP 3',8-cyclase MoaA [Galbitalea soli]NEM90767.1 GTP 3',8-cyclase MoaA [Galbitalea soli]NYJ31485.1 cyclic pyranopterin phosphate synthase [Galbitalea soli]
MSVSLGIPTLPASAAAAGADAVAGAPRPRGESALLDRFGRVATDLRISLTDKCNLRCTYCMPAEGLPFQPADRLMQADEIVRLAGIAVRDLGVRQVRFTGGEPLLRKDLVEIIAAVAGLEPRPEISLTTNAIGLASRAAELAAAGLDRINVSLDTVHAATFLEVTRRPFLDRVLAGIDAAAAAGLRPVKINAVLLRGVNDDQAAELLAWSIERGHQLRFIEQMPLDADHSWERTTMVTAAETRARLAERFTLVPDAAPRDGAPAELYRVLTPDGSRELGTVGIIASVTENFCGDCRRTRLTSEGAVRSCLFSHQETSLLSALREGASDHELAELWRGAMWAKPAGHGLDTAGFVQPERTMSAIGG